MQKIKNVFKVENIIDKYIAIDDKDRIIYLADNIDELLKAVAYFKSIEEQYSVKIYQLLHPDLKRILKDLLD